MHFLRILTLFMALLVALPRTVCAQTAEEKARIAEQRRIVEQLEREVAASEKALSAIKKDKSTAQQRVKSITRQINSRNQLLSRTEREIGAIERNITLNDSLIAKTNEQILNERERYAEMVREAYRNYKQNNYITYLLASESFTDAARRIANIRAVAVLRAERLHRIDSLSKALDEQQLSLTARRHSLDSVQRRAEAQRTKLQGDVRSAQQAMKQLTTREQKALREQMENEERLDAAIDALRQLTKGNKEGASFSRTTSNLNLPVVGGKVKEYKGNMAVITGAKGASVRSIYDGKVVEVRRNRISGKYDVFVAHGEYITSYAGLDNVTVAKDAKVAKNGTLGTIGASVNLASMTTEYRVVFGIYSPNAKETMRAADCFKKK
ncbi:MAG: peptidoglycan DD-metalloendopeptidase family protein [Alistipes sp.]|nr:peptidoglycan DD-metalloendopeptidase family protein [Alistipes sp.]